AFEARTRAFEQPGAFGENREARGDSGDDTILRPGISRRRASVYPRVVREKHTLPARPEHAEKLLRRPLRALGQRGAPHENGAAPALLERRKEARRLSGGPACGEAGDQPVEDVRRDARAPVEEENMARRARVPRLPECVGPLHEGGSLLAPESLQPVPHRGRHARISEKELVRRTRVPEQRPEAPLENGQVVVRENDDVYGVRRAIE